MSRADRAWELMYAEYIARVPKPVYKEDPPPKTRLDQETKDELQDEEPEETL